MNELHRLPALWVARLHTSFLHLLSSLYSLFACMTTQLTANDLGRRLRLKTVPISKSVAFGAEDVYELISLLTARPGIMCVILCMYASRPMKWSLALLSLKQ